MAFCNKCGNEVHDDAVVCIHCGCSIGNNPNKSVTTKDNDSIGWSCLGFCVPVAGLILWLMWKDEAPKKAKNAGVGALVSVILAGVSYIAYFITIMVAVMGS